jgi:hypothetical protein
VSKDRLCGRLGEYFWFDLRSSRNDDNSSSSSSSCSSSAIVVATMRAHARLLAVDLPLRYGFRLD